MTATGGIGRTPAWRQAVRPRLRSAMIVTRDERLRGDLAFRLRSMRWEVCEADSGAAMFAMLEQYPAQVVVLDSWLADLDVQECVTELRSCRPDVDVMALDGAEIGTKPPRHACSSEVLHAMRQAQQQMEAPGVPVSTAPAEPDAGDDGAGNDAAASDDPVWTGSLPEAEILRRYSAANVTPLVADTTGPPSSEKTRSTLSEAAVQPGRGLPAAPVALPELVGRDPRLLEVSRRIRLVAERRTAVLVHGPTGTGKELVARAIHRLSGRGAFVAVNCAAIPEALAEAELFGHVRGAFTGAMQSRTGRIQAAAGGTLFLDEIGELSPSAQSKLLRFLESGEVQRVGENETTKVNARVVAATHRKLGAMAAEGSFRADLLHRLSVFLIETPPLAGRAGDIDELIRHTLASLAEGAAGKQIDAQARAKLLAHSWPGNVRELAHTLERAWILAGDSVLIDERCIEFGEALY